MTGGVSKGVQGGDGDETGRNCVAGVAVLPRVSAVPEISAIGEVVGLLQFQVRQLLRIKEAPLDRAWPTVLSANPGEAVQLAARWPRALQIEQEKISSTMPLISSSKARWASCEEGISILGVGSGREKEVTSAGSLMSVEIGPESKLATEK